MMDSPSASVDIRSYGTPTKEIKEKIEKRRNRVCKTDGCNTILSIYSSQSHCFLHRRFQYRVPERR